MSEKKTTAKKPTKTFATFRALKGALDKRNLPRGTKVRFAASGGVEVTCGDLVIYKSSLADFTIDCAKSLGFKLA